MINWWGLSSNSIWIIAIALILAVVSIAYYQSQREGKKISTVLKSQNYSLILNISAALFCLGMASTLKKWWEIVVWLVLMGIFGVHSWVTYGS